MSDEFGEHLTRDQRSFLHTESLQILQIHRSMLAPLLFSSAHSFSIGTGMAEATFCAQLHIFVLILMFVFGSLSWWKIQTRPSIRFLAEAVRFSLFLTRCPGPPAKTKAHSIKDPVFNRRHVVHFILFAPNTSSGLESGPF